MTCQSNGLAVATESLGLAASEGLPWPVTVERRVAFFGAALTRREG